MKNEKANQLRLTRREFLLIFASLLGAAGVAAACEPGPATTSTPLPAEATKSPSKATQVLTEIYRAITRTPTPKSETAPSPTKAPTIEAGSPGEDSLIPPYKLAKGKLGVTAAEFKQANPNQKCELPAVDTAPAGTLLQEFVSPDGEIYAASAIDPEYMNKLLGLKTDKNGQTVGSYKGADGQDVAVTQVGDYQYVNDKGEVFISLQPGSLGFGFVCTSSDQLKYGAVDGDYRLATQLWPMFDSPANVAKRYGYPGKLEDVRSISLEKTADQKLTGRMLVRTEQTTTKMHYVGDVRTEVVPNDPKIEAIRKTVGDRLSDWIKWSSAADAYEVDLVFSGKDAVKKESLPIADGKGNLIGTTLLTCTGQYLIGDNLSQLTFPLYWQEQSTGLVHSWNGGKFARSDIYDSDLTAFSVMNTSLLGGVRWQPGEVIKVYVNKPDKTAVTHKNDFWTPVMAKIWSDREPDFANFVNNGVSPGIVIISLTPGTCQDFELEKDIKEWGGFLCKRDTKIVPGY